MPNRKMLGNDARKVWNLIRLQGFSRMAVAGMTFPLTERQADQMFIEALRAENLEAANAAGPAVDRIPWDMGLLSEDLAYLAAEHPLGSISQQIDADTLQLLDARHV